MRRAVEVSLPASPTESWLVGVSRQTESGPKFLTSLIQEAPLAVYSFYSDADLEAIAATNPELIDALADAYIKAKLGAADAS